MPSLSLSAALMAEITDSASRAGQPVEEHGIALLEDGLRFRERQRRAADGRSSMSATRRSAIAKKGAAARWAKRKEDSR